MTVYQEVQANWEELCQVRHALHRCPELGHREEKTVEIIRACLERWGIPAEGRYDTGLTARIRGGKPGKLLALREDMDALPMEENTGLPFASEIPGMCHACGHDVHTAALLGCAQVLSRRREELRGDVLLVFQCAEETFDGAAAMLARGLFQKETPQAVVGFHCEPGLPVGTMGVRRGISNASCDSIRIRVDGRGGHGAHPESCVDPIVLGAGLLMELQTLVSRVNRPTDPVVLTFGEIHGGTAPNIIPDWAELRGTMRTLDNGVRLGHLERMARLCPDFCRAMGGDCTFTVEKGVPPLVNALELCDQLDRSVERALGPGRLVVDPTPSMGSDDFACLIQACGGRGMQFLAGTRLEGCPQSGLGLHAAENIFPDEALVPAAAVLAQFALDYLSGADGERGV